MARKVQDREDLLRDATALVRRVQLTCLSGRRCVVLFAGFRAQGAASFYFDQDPVYHFNNSGQLRRAFVDGALIAAERGRLIVLQRQPGEVAVNLLRRQMSDREQAQYCQSAAERLSEIRQAIAEGNFTVAGQVAPAEDGDADVVTRLQDYLARRERIEVAASPRVGN